jgi:hypothetical protein
MAFKMKGFPMHAGTSAPMKQTPIIGGDAGDSKITREMIEEKNRIEKEYNNLLAEEGFSTDTDLSGASEELKALKAKFDKLRQPFIKENMEKLEEKKAEGKGLFQMKGWSPFHQEGPVDKKNPPVGKGEHPDTWVYPGGDMRERIIDLEDRIEFIKEDIWNQDGKATKAQEKQLKKLKQELAILRKRKKNK